jgi:sporulation protein YlmC with PRC-barrel domain
MEKVSELLRANVVTASGKYCGRVIEVRSAGEPEHGASNNDRQITELVCGRQGLLESMGLRRAIVRVVPWQSVKRIEHATIVVDD